MDWDVRGQDLDTYYASFGRRALPDGAIWRLSMASSSLPERHVGYQAWLTTVAGVRDFVPELQQWAVGLGATVARMKPRGRKFVVEYDHAWGKQASLDGLKMGLFGNESVPGIRARADDFGCSWRSYQRIRDFVAASLALAIWQYRDALVWVTKRSVGMG